MANPFPLLVLLFPITLAAPALGAAPAERAGAAGCQPLETRPPNVPSQKPAFAGQTRACEAASNADLEVAVVTKGLEHPWAVEPLPDGDLLVTERPGRMRIVSADGELGPPLQGLPEVFAENQGGLLDVALSPDFESDRTVFWSYSEPRGEQGNTTAVARGKLSRETNTVEEVEVIFRVEPAYDGDMHYGSRLVFDDDGRLYVTLGERSDKPMREHAQRLDTHLGTLVRIETNGDAPRDNPFAEKDDARPEIFTYGHRNVQAAAFDADGRLWVVEHGARGGDELNLIEAGNNYGWPLVAYGEEYSGEPIRTAKTRRPRGNFTQPVYYWDPVIAPSGATFYASDAIPEWQGSLFTGALVDKELVRLVIEDGKVTGEERLLGERGQRVRDVREGPNGELYVVTDEAQGELWRIAPRS